MRRFTNAEDDLIKKEYLICTCKGMGDKINRSMSSVYGRMKYLGLKVPDEIKKKRLIDCHKNILAGVEFRFKKGHSPHNKGKEWNEFMSKEGQENSRKTTYKKGNVPNNIKHFGRPYLAERLMVGITEKTWFIQESGSAKREHYLKYLCRLNGINLKGKKPRLKEGYNINNCPTMNDIVIVSNKENMKLNSFINLPLEVREIIQCKRVLTRHINNYGK